MRTTIDLPDDLLRRAKATAALRGQKLKDLVASCIELGLASPEAATPTFGHRTPLPEFACLSGKPVRALSNAQIEDILTQEELRHHGLDRSA